jgi:RNA polymerase sigma-70 factor (ECF subfamily)
MVRIETTTGDPHFQNTDWSVVFRGAQAQAAEAREALDRLLRSYWKPVYFYIRRAGHPVEDAKDLAQDFFTQLLDSDLLARVERTGRFRSFLLAVVNGFLANKRREAGALKRGGGRQRVPFDAAEAERELPPGPEAPDRAYGRAWATAVLGRALDRLEQSLEAEGRGVCGRLLRAQADGATHDELARRFELSPTDVNNYLHRARVRLRDELEREIRPTVMSESDLREEIADLLRAFS